jgi:hypothetical protein
LQYSRQPTTDINYSFGRRGVPKKACVTRSLAFLWEHFGTPYEIGDLRGGHSRISKATDATKRELNCRVGSYDDIVCNQSRMRTPSSVGGSIVVRVHTELISRVERALDPSGLRERRGSGRCGVGPEESALCLSILNTVAKDTSIFVEIESVKDEWQRSYTCETTAGTKNRLVFKGQCRRRMHACIFADARHV